jgi:hypothetical protein
MYWASYSGLSEEAEELVEHRDGNIVSIPLYDTVLNGTGTVRDDSKVDAT